MPISHFRSALQFITAIPAGRTQPFDAPSMSAHFPLVGLCLGAIVAAADFAALRLWSAPAAAALDVALLLVLTGAFHLDGLGDSADGLFSHRSRPEMLAIMKDSRIGIMGVAAVVCVLGVKWAGIRELDWGRTWSLILVPGYARAGMLFGMRFLPYGRAEQGLGTEFFRRRPGLRAFWGLALLAVLSAVLGWRGLVLNAGFLAVTALILLYYRRRLGCITGDTLGAMTECTEAALFLLLAAL
jgi:adenosylcobinamide-GDP ribazoletransferase